jgi:MFS family permease
VLTEALNWHWIFFINIPIGIAVAFAASRIIDADKGLGLRDGADVPGAVLVTSALMLGVYTIVKPAAELGWSSSQTLILGAVALALLAGFVIREHTAATPLMPLRIFKSRNVTGANIIQVLSVAGMFGVFFMGSLYLERVLGYGPLQIGLAFLPVTVIMGTLSVRYSERLVMRFGARRTLIPGLFAILAALVLFTQAPADGSFLRGVLPVMVLMGAGAGLAFPALMNLAMSGAKPEEAGLASGLVNTTAQVGGALGLAVLATLANGRTETLMHGGAQSASAMTGGFHLAFWVAAALVVAAIIAAVAILKPADESTMDEAFEQELEPAYA